MLEKRIYHSDKQKGSAWKPLVVGTDVTRYQIIFPGDQFIKYGKWLMYPSNEKLMAGPKILLRQTSDRIRACYDEKGYYCQNSVFIVHANNLNLRYLLGLMNSKLFGFIYQINNPQTGKVFAEVKPTVVKQLPICKIDLEKTIDKFRHDKLVQFVDKMLDLTPKMQAAKSETDKATLQNAITATDNKIDRLVYDLYGLTEDEIKLVEESSVNNK